jgi:hypothetical protein
MTVEEAANNKCQAQLCKYSVMHPGSKDSQISANFFRNGPLNDELVCASQSEFDLLEHTLSACSQTKRHDDATCH